MLGHDADSGKHRPTCNMLHVAQTGRCWACLRIAEALSIAHVSIWSTDEEPIDLQAHAQHLGAHTAGLPAVHHCSVRTALQAHQSDFADSASCLTAMQYGKVGLWFALQTLGRVSWEIAYVLPELSLEHVTRVTCILRTSLLHSTQHLQRRASHGPSGHQLGSL